MKIIAIVGPTATGKSDLAVRLAKKFSGEIICADSRTIYRGLDIGTAKPQGKWIPLSPSLRGRNRGGLSREKNKDFIYKSVPHHLIDFLSPKKTFSAADFVRKASVEITNIHERGHLPIVCGGTGFWIDALFNPALLSTAKPNPALRKKLEKKSTEQLFKQLQKIDPVRAKTIDRFNKRRLIRALEIADSSVIPAKAGIHDSGSRIPPSLKFRRTSKPGMTNSKILFLGLTLPHSDLKTQIRKRFLIWLKLGLIAETKELTRQVSKKRLQEIGLSYPIIAEYIKGAISKDEMIERSVNSIYHYAKRQKTWFKKNPNIVWIKNARQAEKLARQYLDKKIEWSNSI